MIKALIVDDEKLVRKGLITTTPWARFGIEIVGEASNGKAALAYLRNHEVDLLIADLTMPVMGGLELMRRVKQQYPSVWSVVLTCHQEFEHIQESMRVGAIDYIVKTQLEKESVEKVLSRITGRIRMEEAHRAIAPVREKKVGGILVDLSVSPSQALPEESGTHRFLAVGVGMWLSLDWEESQLKQLHQSLLGSTELRLVIVTDMKDNPLLQHKKSLQAAVSATLFFEGSVNQTVYEISQQQLLNFHRGDRNEGMESSVYQEWEALHWVYQDAVFEKLLQDSKQSIPDRTRLLNIIYSSICPWQEIFPEGIHREYMKECYALFFWDDHVRFLEAIRNDLLKGMQAFPYSFEVIVSIVKAIGYMQQHVSVSRDELAALVFMSSGYFSECFQMLTGKPFGKYLKELRMAKAGKLLALTSIPMYAVASEVGYKDEKYFSKLFRDHTGQYPTDYRKNLLKSGDAW
ncbi:response regulator [Paenibacillus sepulcri]|uniref:Response regulator n=1 Tax=Paenibacillus sepulcri TaxID=359917 RepID=A0ABS7BY76_9BACL|nr:response regulator [Paenibacillus sepulcri]